MRATSTKRLPVEALLSHLGELFVAGRLREITRFWSFPCPVELEGELIVMQDADALEAFLRRRREEARQNGLRAMTPRITAVEVPRGGRFRVWLRWSYLLGDRLQEDVNPSLYYMLRKPSGELSIEMMELVRVPNEARSA